MTAKCKIDGCDRNILGRGWCSAHYKRWMRHGDHLAGNTPLGEPISWLENVAMAADTDECLDWPYAKAVGYGSVKIDGKTQGVHRVVCSKAHGKPPLPEMEAAHNCGNPGCCNPRHLRWATPVENCADKKVHGTQPRGEKVGGSRLKDDDVLEMRRLRRMGLTYQAIADKFNHELGATRRAIIGETWSHLSSEKGEAA